MRPRSTVLPSPPISAFRAAVVATALATVAAACGRRQPETALAPAAAGEAEADTTRFTAVWPQNAVVPIEIQNNHTLDLTIYAVQSGASQRLGMATAVKSTYLRVPVRHLGPGNELRLMAHAIGGSRRLQSDQLVVLPGQRVVWTIESGFRHANASVWE